MSRPFFLHNIEVCTINDFVKSQNLPFLSFSRKREYSNFDRSWTPAFAGVTVYRTFNEIVKNLCVSSGEAALYKIVSVILFGDNR